MKILVCSNLDMFRLTIGWALESLGHHVYYIDTYDVDKMMKATQSFQPDLILDMGWDVIHITENAIPNLQAFKKQQRLFHLYFAEEDHYHFERWSQVYVNETRPNFVLTRFPAYQSKYEAMGISSDFLNVGCNPYLHKPTTVNPNYACDVAIVANGQFQWDAFRRKSINDLIVPLLNAPFVTKIWGRDWHEMGQYLGVSLKSEMIQGSLPFYETPMVYNSAKINISLQIVNNQISSRTYDILSSRGFLLTSDTPGVRAVLQPDVNCVVSSSPEETVKKIRYYLQHPFQSRQIASKGMELAHDRFAYQRTLLRVLPRIENEARKFNSLG